MAAVMLMMTTTVITSSVENPRSSQQPEGRDLINDIDIALESVACAMPTPARLDQALKYLKI
jgi:hypothetical protein